MYWVNGRRVDFLQFISWCKLESHDSSSKITSEQRINWFSQLTQFAIQQQPTMFCKKERQLWSVAQRGGYTYLTAFKTMTLSHLCMYCLIRSGWNLTKLIIRQKNSSRESFQFAPITLMQCKSLVIVFKPKLEMVTCEAHLQEKNQREELYLSAPLRPFWLVRLKSMCGGFMLLSHHADWDRRFDHHALKRLAVPCCQAVFMRRRCRVFPFMQGHQNWSFPFCLPIPCRNQPPSLCRSLGFEFG